MNTSVQYLYADEIILAEPPHKCIQ